MKVNHNFFRTVILFLFVFAIASIYAGDVNSDDIQTAAPSVANRMQKSDYITATNIFGNTVRQTALLRGTSEKSDKLVWHDNFSEAFYLAKTEKKWLLLLSDEYATQSESNKYNSYDWNNIKETLLENFVLLYVCHPIDNFTSNYTADLGPDSPFIAIIDPEKPQMRIRGRGHMPQNQLLDFVDLDKLQLSPVDTRLEDNGTTKLVEMSILQKDAVIHYRLDSEEPTTSDPIYSAPLHVTSGMTVSARAFINGVPISDIVTKTYKFDSRIATPILNKNACNINNSTIARDYFVGSCLLTASCDTPGAVIRYRNTTNRYIILFEDDEAIPNEGLLVSETSAITVGAIKKNENGGYIRSETVTTQLVALNEFPEANEIVKGENIDIYTSVTAPWTLQNDVSNNTPIAIKSGYSDLKEINPWDYYKYISWLVIKVNGPGILSFDWKAIRDDNTFIFCVDGTNVHIFQERLPQLNTRTQGTQTFTITQEGEHYLGWLFLTYSNADNGVVWLDNISWKNLVALEISGEDMLDPEENARHTCMATWSDGSTSIIQPTWSISSSESADVDIIGTVTNKNMTNSDQTVTLIAEYSGITTTKNILLSKTKLQKTANPTFNQNETDYFIENCMLTAACSTPDAIIHYTLNGRIPTLDSPVFPSEGLLVSESSIIKVKAFKEGMKASDCVQCKLVEMKEIPEICKDSIAFGYMDMPWLLQSDETSPTNFALQSPELKEYESSSLVAIVNGPGILSYTSKADMILNNWAKFSIDGQTKTIYEDCFTDWSNQTFTIKGEGDHYLIWNIKRGRSLSEAELYNFWLASLIWTKILNDNGFEYTVDDGLVTIRGYSGNNPFITIPNTIDGKPVIDIESETFKARKDISTVILPNGISHIHDYAFYNSSLTSITIPSSVTTIGENAFAACSNLSEIVFTGSPPTFGISSYPTPITFFVQKDMGWEEFEAEGVTVVFRENVPVLTEIVISGDTTIGYGSKSTYTAEAVWNNGTNTQIMPYWSLFPDAYTQLTGNSITNINDTFDDQIITLTARYTFNGITTTSEKSIVLLQKPPTPSSLVLIITQGWNLCSIPFTPNDESVAALKETGVCWGWINGRFKPLETILAGQGFWIYAPSKRELLLKGEEAEPMPLHKGWNLIGPVGDDYCPQDVTGIWQVNRRNMEQISIEKNGHGLQPGKGYWIFIK